MLKSLEIFSGAGGLATGLQNLGVEHLAFVEWNNDACKTLRENYGNDLVHEMDIRDFDLKIAKAADIIAGGPPCQPFSLGGKHKGNLDERDMFPQAVHSIRSIQPKAFVFENVKGLLRESFATYFNYIILQLTYPTLSQKPKETWQNHLKRLEDVHTKGTYGDLKYNVIYRLINAADYGVPQCRERVFIVGIRNDLNVSWSFPNPTHSEESLLYSKYVTGSYWEQFNITDKKIIFNESIDARRIEKLASKYALFPPTELPWQTVRQALARPADIDHLKPEHQQRAGARTYPGHTGSYIDLPAKTLKAGDHGVPGGENMLRDVDNSVRYFTVFEAKRLQTFPDKYTILGSWSEAMRQIGNAVPTALPTQLFSDLLRKLS
ncbi:MAG: DNA cytosine methyltransferase [Flavobacteriales bacterium]|nr:DNA cytosine methyltransferase [Flavobacteriales bacterium]